MLIGFDDQSTFSDGAGFWLPPKIAILTRRPMLVFRTISLPPANIRRHPHAQTYTFGSGLFVSIVPYCGNASVALVDLHEQNVLATQWRPASGFDTDPTDWIYAKDRGRLWCGSAGHTVLELVELLADLMRGHLELTVGGIEALRYGR